jgi:hypothetical protein
MNIIKAQKEIFNAMLSGERCHKYEFDEKSVFITPSGYYGYVIPYSQIQINLAKIPDCNNLDIKSVVREENLCELTNEAVILEHPRRYVRKLKRGNECIYFNEKYMSCFQNPKFYNAYPHQIIVVTEDVSATRQNEIVGVILPVRVTDTMK